ncbi:MAG: formyl-CoA transferase [Gammaproteobacteria bacterium TMED95]|nr:formyl-CoA transferase [Gammaproteobacteria bacterium]OUV20172.1 MAG: formyl-CoA transferase [Gammaproteobacteria bacterium TMED95]
MAKLPLDGLRVIDLPLARAGPVAVRMLADWGAEVIRVEPPAKAGSQDITGQRFGSDAQNLHRNKKNISLNLKTARGYELFLQLVGSSDILVENFRADVKNRLGIDYGTLKEKKPDLIYASISGFGQTGPYKDRPGVDQIVQGMSGLMSLTGDKDGPPTRVGIAISDTSAGMFLGQGILLALIERGRTGRGQWVHTSLLESMINKLDFQAARFTMSGEEPRREGNDHPTFSPMGVFEASDGLVNIAASTGKMFSAFCHALGLSELLTDPRFQSSQDRARWRSELSALINAKTRQFNTVALVKELNAVGCPCGPIYSVKEAFDDPQTQHLAMVTEIEHLDLGTLGLVRSPINLSNHTESSKNLTAAPRLGEHNDEIYQSLGLTLEEIQRCKETEVI